MQIVDRLNKEFGPPAEALRSLRDLLNGESGKRLEMVLTRVENLSKDKATLDTTLQLVQVLRELDKTGGLARLDSIMCNVPRGAEGKALMNEISKLAASFGPKLDKLVELAETIMASDK